LRAVCGQEGAILRFVACTCGQRDYGTVRVLLRRVEAVAAEFQKQDADDEADALVAVDEWMVSDDAAGERRGEVENVMCAMQCERGLGVVLLSMLRRPAFPKHTTS